MWEIGGMGGTGGVGGVRLEWDVKSLGVDAAERGNAAQCCEYE